MLLAIIATVIITLLKCIALRKKKIRFTALDISIAVTTSTSHILYIHTYMCVHVGMRHGCWYISATFADIIVPVTLLCIMAVENRMSIS